MCALKLRRLNELNEQAGGTNHSKEFREELVKLIIIYIVLSVMLQVGFYKESVMTVQRFLWSLYWLFILPGFLLLLPWRNGLNFIERAAIGTALSLAAIGTGSYYAGIIGIPIRIHRFIFPPALIAVGAIISWGLRRKSRVA